MDTSQQKWWEDINASPKLQSYARFKSEISFDKYLLMNIPKHMRQWLILLRCASVKLEIEVGRHENIDRSQRICKLCNEHVEDDYHFVMICKKLDTVRAKYLSNLIKPQNLYTFQSLMKCNIYNNVHSLALYLQEAWKIRTNILNAMR
jgi:hypothetical protein